MNIIPMSSIRRDRALARLATDIQPIADQIIAVAAKHGLNPEDVRRVCLALGDLTIAARPE